MKKRFIAALAAAAMLLGSVGAYAAPVEVLEDELSDMLEVFVWLEVVDGYPDGTFRPDDPLTRAQACKLAARTLWINLKMAELSDISGHWAEDYINLCVTQGLIGAYADGTFKPDDAISKADFAALALGLAGMTGLDGQELAQNALALLGIDTALPGGISRGEAIAALFEAMTLPLGVKDVDGYAANLAGATALATLIASKVVMRAEGLMRPFVLAGQAENGRINGIELDDYALALTFDRQANGYAAADPDPDAIMYNFTALYDTDQNGLADCVVVVSREDGEKIWDSSLTFGEDFSNEYNIPYGERMLYFGLSGAYSDYSNIVASGDLEGSTYWPTYDWYNSSSSDTLTILPRFKTIQQASGWACGVTSALMVLEWYGERGGLNENDLSVLRDKVVDGTWRWGGYTDLQMLINVFTHLNKMAGSPVWSWVSTYDFVSPDGELDPDYLSPDWIRQTLAQGHPILVGWDDWGGHWQVIIGYDDMGTEWDTDDILLLADPYDSTDHLNDGVIIQSYQRLYYNWNQSFDRDFGLGAGGSGVPVIMVPVPDNGWQYSPVSGGGLSVSQGEPWARVGAASDHALLPYGATADDLELSDYAYAKSERGQNGLAGPAGNDWYRAADAVSPYYPGFDFYTDTPEDISGTLVLLEHFKTSQQASEWTCGPAALRTALAWFGGEAPSEFALSALRGDDGEYATTLDGMTDMLAALNDQGGDWAWISSDDMDDEWQITDELGLDYGEDGGLIPYFLRRGIPVVVGWNEWGGHWMVVIGYDDMGTEGTQDDVIIIADPYDTTDHCQDGYLVESYERLIYGWTASFDERGSEVFLVFAPQAVMESAGF